MPKPNHEAYAKSIGSGNDSPPLVKPQPNDNEDEKKRGDTSLNVSVPTDAGAVDSADVSDLGSEPSSLRSRRPTQLAQQDLRHQRPSGPRPSFYPDSWNPDDQRYASYSFNPPQAPLPDPEKQRIKAQLEALQTEKERETIRQRQAQNEAKIRADTEEAFRQRLEAIRLAQEEHQKELQIATAEA